MRQIILDTETTGLQTAEGHRIIEIGCVELINRKLTGNHYHQYINPERPIDEGALAVHGLAQDFLQTKPVFADIVDEFIEFVRGAELVIHNAPFDTGFLNYEFGLIKKKPRWITDYCRILDTLALARQLHVGQRNSLDALCKRYNVENAHREWHGALLDAQLLAQVYLAMTGGQGSLFEGMQTADTVSEASQDIPLKKLTVSNNRKIIVATTDDMAAHEQKLQAMSEKGKCVWQEEF
ncbi:MAG TPA: DNA polymerase III subunit epsilon [Gammaproteobacteria bacterium]|nr:DNA polymerase III subunit epsilon [Gammaproteobacteria bacterium]